MRQGRRDSGFAFCDFAFLFLAAAFAWLVFRGIVPFSGFGAVLDSDLQTYAQGMAGAALQGHFAADPAIHAASPANSIPNLERMLGEALAPPGEWAAGLLRAGAIAIFVFYAGWYILGRRIYDSPALSALLSVVCGVTVWVGWGTFWGITHSDPIPRVFFAAIMPFLLLLGIEAISRPNLRPIAMFACGLAIWVHGVSALNCGAMIFTAFMFIPAKEAKPAAHCANLFLCLIAFFVPVLIFLWPSLRQKPLSQEDLALFQELFALRWHEDYGKFGERMASFFSFSGPVFPILAGGLAGWLVVIFKGSGREKLFCKMAPCFLLALFCVAGFCWLETWLAPRLGRAPMGHELVRGMRFLVPVAWILIVAGVGCVTGKKSRRLLLVCAVVAVLAISHDRQYAAARYAFDRLAGLKSACASEANHAQAMRALFEKIRRVVPEGEAVYSPEDAMQIRYISQRPLAHSFKDGYAHFYNRDAKGARKWLKLEKLSRSGTDGYLKAWRESGAPWLFCRDTADKASLLPLGEIALDENGWLLVRKRD